MWGDGGGDLTNTHIRNTKGLKFIQHFLGFLLDDEVNVDIGIKQVSHLQILSGVHEWAIAISHKIIREIV
ncbi:hypothetical protein [Nostoc sp.]|uniref:hypothetical protein n=1 Tax=Nostoc sp. TaxID=1180 RepID=UPI002FF856C0